MKSRLKKIALMPTEMFKAQLDQISDKGRDVLKVLEEYKFFVEQTSRVMKNDPALTEVIMGKKKNLEESAQKIYDIVFDIENLDISALYDRQQEVTDNEDTNSPQPEESEDLKLPDSEEPPKNPEPSKTTEAPVAPEEPKEDKVEKEEPKEEEKSDEKEKSKSRLKNKSEDDEDSKEDAKKDTKEKEDKK